MNNPAASCRVIHSCYHFATITSQTSMKQDEISKRYFINFINLLFSCSLVLSLQNRLLTTWSAVRVRPGELVFSRG